MCTTRWYIVYIMSPEYWDYDIQHLTSVCLSVYPLSLSLSSTFNRFTVFHAILPSNLSFTNKPNLLNFKRNKTHQSICTNFINSKSFKYKKRHQLTKYSIVFICQSMICQYKTKITMHIPWKTKYCFA